MQSYSYEELAAKDKACVWHPFTQMQDYVATDPLIVERGEGRKLVDVNGRAYYDGVSSLWVNVHGHRCPEIDHAIRDQLDRVAHSTLLGLANVPSILLAEKLLAVAPRSLTKVFYSDSGSEAVEIALKMAYRYWQLRGDSRRRYFIKMTNAYHGDTVGAVAVGGMDLFHGAFHGLLFETLAAPYPYPYRFPGSPEACSQHCVTALDEILAKRRPEVIGVIVEPLVQGAAGMIVMPAGFLRAVQMLCRQYGVLLLADEVATGFGRTGRMFACEHEGVEPDLMMVAKGLTGGYLPLAATLTSEEVYSAFLGPYASKRTFFHGHSYTGNQLACAAALANLELFARRNVVAEVARKAELVRAWLQPLADLPHVGEVRGKGLMFGVELVRDRQTKEEFDWDLRVGYRVCDRARELGMLLRPLGNVVVFMPPLGSTDEELQEMTAILRQAVTDVTSNLG